MILQEYKHAIYVIYQHSNSPCNTLVRWLHECNPPSRSDTYLLATAGVAQQSLLLAIAYQLNAGRVRHVLHGQVGHLLQYAGVGPAWHCVRVRYVITCINPLSCLPPFSWLLTWHFAKERGRLGAAATQRMPAIIANGIDNSTERGIHQRQRLGPVTSVSHQRSRVAVVVLLQIYIINMYNILYICNIKKPFRMHKLVLNHFANILSAQDGRAN